MRKTSSSLPDKKPFGTRLKEDWMHNKWKYIMLVPVVIYFIVFSYKPMYGVIIAFKNYRPNKGIMGSEWVGFLHFKNFFQSPDFGRILRNTFSISGLGILFGFPAPILLALLLNEIRNEPFKRVVQTITYLPHFVAMVIICGLLKTFCLSDGVFNTIIQAFGGTATPLLQDSKFFYPILIGSDIWQGIGWGSIIYLAAIAGVDQEQYEAARIDGLNEVQIFFRMFFPTMRSTYAAAAVITFMNAWNAYLWPKVIMTDGKSLNMVMLIANTIGGYKIDYGMIMMGVLFCSIPTMLVFFILQKQFAEGITGAVK